MICVIQLLTGIRLCASESQAFYSTSLSVQFMAPSVCVCVYQVREREKDREFILLPLLSFHQLYFHLCTVSSELDVDVGLSNTLPPSLFTGLPLV